MSESKQAKNKAVKAEESTPEVMLKVKVIKSGTHLNYAKCAKGLVTRTAKSTAEALQAQGLVQIIGA